MIEFLILFSLQSPAGQNSDEVSFDDVYDQGAQWVEDPVPDEILEEIQIPSKEDWRIFWREVERVLHS
ncbi:MAG: hypothetical protein HYS07_03780 [Chlamydiae bacterium]|nr:hypothetical protein [Chlamydiota bacterium]MBI3277131.1 hypothetical protein [Chlamydiota bacterium]